MRGGSCSTGQAAPLSYRIVARRGPEVLPRSGDLLSGPAVGVLKLGMRGHMRIKSAKHTSVSGPSVQI